LIPKRSIATRPTLSNKLFLWRSLLKKFITVALQPALQNWLAVEQNKKAMREEKREKAQRREKEQAVAKLKLTAAAGGFIGVPPTPKRSCDLLFLAAAWSMLLEPTERKTIRSATAFIPGGEKSQEKNLLKWN
jgi:hypothetical protein